jgi:pimeloyl-ACP methyl ester carboxylesterase
VRRRSPLDVTEEVLAHGMPCLAWGSGHPLVFLRGFSTTHTNPTGLQRLAEIRLLQGLAEHFRIHAVGRAPGLPRGTTMADIATQHADALLVRFREPVDVLGVSSGGSIALQLAADHPALVRRLVVAASGYRLGEEARQAQLRYVAAVAEGRRGAQYLAPFKVSSTLGRWLTAPLMWLFDPLMRPADPSDMVAFAHAEDAFDLHDRLSDIGAPTLVIAGERDAVYPADVVGGTATGTLTHPRFATDVASFLLAE